MLLIKAKPFWKSKSFGLGVLVALLPFIETANIDTGSHVVNTAIGLAIMGVRMATNGPVSMNGEKDVEVK